jgi:hypothetical protein
MGVIKESARQWCRNINYALSPSARRSLAPFLHRGKLKIYIYKKSLCIICEWEKDFPATLARAHTHTQLLSRVINKRVMRRKKRGASRASFPWREKLILLRDARRDQIISAVMEHEFHLGKNNESERAAAAIYCCISRDGKKC